VPQLGLLGGMIGLGGAEFRLPLLIGLFGFVALQAVILNKAMPCAACCCTLFDASALGHAAWKPLNDGYYLMDMIIDGQPDLTGPVTNTPRGPGAQNFPRVSVKAHPTPTRTRRAHAPARTRVG
jgi:hypothetical protein